MGNIYKALGIVIILFVIVGGSFSFALNLREDIKYKNEMNELEKEKLRLEIKIKKIQLGIEEHST